ncbi:MAG TPA: hypothetical protein VJU53_04020 [Burkholderiaceae bacterium]|nr:hypothetical protein [Burkholderiaceae bacterium]
MNTLVILGSSITALAVARDAHAHGLRPVVVDTERGPAFSCRWVVSEQVRPTDTEGILAQLLQLAGSSSALVSTADHWLRFLIEHRTVLQRAYGSILHPSNEALAICLDKSTFAHWCLQNDLLTPRSWIGGKEVGPLAPRFPLLIRPARTLHDRGFLGLPKALEVQDERELHAWLARYAEKQVEPLISESLLGRDIDQSSISFARRDSDMLVLSARKVRPRPERCSVGSCVELHADPVAEQLARVAAERLDYFGIGEMEILHDRSDGQHYVIEINARPWIQYALAPASGHDFLGLVLNVPSKRTARRVKSGKTWINLHADLFNAFSRSVGDVRQGRLAAGAYVASALRSNVFALFDWRDPKPFLASLRRRGA